VTATGTMRLLLFSDLHADVAAARRLVGMAAGVDLLIGAGDFGNQRRDYATCIEILRATGKEAVLVPGNNESAEELTGACRGWPGAHVLHGSGARVGGVTFYGLGGGVPVTPFGAWSYDLTEAAAAGLLSGCPTGCVLVSHSPPKGAADVSSRGQSIGSTAVRAAIERVSPLLVVCGHVHASAGRQEMIDDTPVVNAGPGGIVWSLPVPHGEGIQ